MIDFLNKYGQGGQGVGTPINRKNMMGVQGFEALTTSFLDDGSIVEHGETGELVTTFISDTQINETFYGNSGNTIVKITTIQADGSIKEEITGK